MTWIAKPKVEITGVPRNELGLIKPAEEFYQVVPPPPGIYKDSDTEGDGVRGDGV